MSLSPSDQGFVGTRPLKLKKRYHDWHVREREYCYSDAI